MENTDPRAIVAAAATNAGSFREAIISKFAEVKAEKSALEQAMVELDADNTTGQPTYRVIGVTWGDAAHFLNLRDRYIELCRDWDWLVGLLRMSDADAVIAYMTAQKLTPEQWATSFVDSLGK
jgi:hypothetical protein